jgi:hypothetical protein
MPKMSESPRRSLPRRLFRVAYVIVTLTLTGWLAIELGLRFLRNQDIAEACGRSFQREDTIADDAFQSTFGSVHKVGESRQDDGLYATANAWPKHCEGSTPTLLFSHKSDGVWQVWALRGGP